MRVLAAAHRFFWEFLWHAVDQFLLMLRKTSATSDHLAVVISSKVQSLSLLPSSLPILTTVSDAVVGFLINILFSQPVFYRTLIRSCCRPTHLYLRPVYTIQPIVRSVVKQVWQPGKCLCTRYNRLSNPLSNRLYNRLNEQWLFVQHGCQTCLTTRLYRVNGVLHNQLHTLR